MYINREILGAELSVAIGSRNYWMAKVTLEINLPMVVYNWQGLINFAMWVWEDFSLFQSKMLALVK